MQTLTHSRNFRRTARPRGSWLVLALLVATAAAGLFGQAVSPPAAPPASATRVPPPGITTTGPGASTEAPLILSPFEVVSDRDRGYQATSTLAGTRLNSDLKDVAASISVITKDFMEDIAANDLESLLTYTLGTEVAGQGGNFSNAEPGGAGEGLNFNSALERITIGTRVRGLTSADTTRGFFPSSIPVDSYNMERAEISREPDAAVPDFLHEDNLARFGAYWSE